MLWLAQENSKIPYFAGKTAYLKFTAKALLHLAYSLETLNFPLRKSKQRTFGL
jgi:hypothetical protein